MEESFKYHIPEDIPANERTAFHGAAAAAAKDGKKSFNFNGKTHPVTMKKDTAKAIADQKESKMTFREKLMSIFENDRAKHYKSAAEAEPMDNNLKGAGAKKMKADIQGNAADIDLEKKSHDDAAKAGRAGPSMKARSNDNKQGDKKIINPPTDETKKGQGPKVATESYGVSGNTVSDSLLKAYSVVEEYTHEFDVDHNHVHDVIKKAKAAGIKAKIHNMKGPGGGNPVVHLGHKDTDHMHKFIKKHYDPDYKKSDLNMHKL